MEVLMFKTVDYKCFSDLVENIHSDFNEKLLSDKVAVITNPKTIQSY